MTKILFCALVVLIPVGGVVAASPGDVQAALADYNRAPEQRYRYLFLADTKHEAAVKFCVVSATREPLLDRTVPSRLPGTALLRISLAQLRWSEADWIASFGAGQQNPLVDPAHQNPLIIHAGYFVSRVMDQTASDAYIRLVFGKQIKTRIEFLAFFGIDPAKQDGLEFGAIEARSGINVARNAARLLRHDDGTNAESWTTFDTKKVEPGKNPHETLDDTFKFDGTEWFVLRPVVSTKGVRGVLPVTGLANAQGNIVGEAPADLVVDSTRVGGKVTVRNPISCVSCHTAGAQRLSGNSLRERRAAGVKLKALDYEKQTKADLYHLGELDTSFDRWDDGYTAALSAINGLTPEQNSTAVAACFNAYVADLTLETAAADLCCDPAELRLALGYASLQKIDIGPGLAALPHGIAMPRSDFEHNYLRAEALLKVWRAAK